MEFNQFYVSNKEGKSNCVIRSFCKVYNKDYDEVYRNLCKIAEINNKLYTDIEVFETYMKQNNTLEIDYGKNIKIRNLNLDNGSYIVFCYDKDNYYHMIPIINNTIYDKDDNSLDLYTIKVYKNIY